MQKIYRRFPTLIYKNEIPMLKDIQDHNIYQASQGELVIDLGLDDKQIKLLHDYQIYLQKSDGLKSYMQNIEKIDLNGRFES